MLWSACPILIGVTFSAHIFPSRENLQKIFSHKAISDYFACTVEATSITEFIKTDGEPNKFGSLKKKDYADPALS
jgi:hypothetical protein